MDGTQSPSSATAVAAPAAGPGPVPAYYSAKTEEIIRKYGNGGRGAPHYHLGLFDGPLPTSQIGPEAIRERICRAQEAMLERAARRWGVFAAPPGSLLDIGCGLGGGSLYWAQEHGARVTALTNTAAHIPHLWEFSRAAGVADRISPVLMDVHDLSTERAYDAAVAFESTNHMERYRLFEVVARALRPGGWFGIEDHFLTGDRAAEYLNDYYTTRLGTFDEYLSAARAAGLELADNDDVTAGVTEFWVQSMAWSATELERAMQSGDAGETTERTGFTTARLAESARKHGIFFRLWRDREVETRLLLFRLPPR
ncbi:SAM-dependent methyltransferase [Streptomyces aidingensis]|uniref:Tocopherol O-methyltransferase n=1 Tax=Streptomyces aidingensis TaxID=910347 RepID=A0A1I1IWK9_9ACTN|nr:methyltransferase domain-containing protein [Streptomyces aidingensis]SFC40565.1 tocopherol O-methyltransferase [Streptomyces aidingensis]